MLIQYLGNFDAGFAFAAGNTVFGDVIYAEERLSSQSIRKSQVDPYGRRGLVDPRNAAVGYLGGLVGPVGILGDDASDTRWLQGALDAPDGLALVDLGSLVRGLTPEIHSADGTRLDFGTILGIFQSPNLALMKFEHRPQAWLRLGQQEPEVEDTVALVLLDRQPARLTERYWV